MIRSVIVLCTLLLMLITWTDLNAKVEGLSDGDDTPVPKLKSRFAVPVVKFLICQS